MHPPQLFLAGFLLRGFVLTAKATVMTASNGLLQSFVKVRHGKSVLVIEHGTLKKVSLVRQPVHRWK
jgi:hypothetical protein